MAFYRSERLYYSVIIVSLFCINIVEVHAQENGTHSFVELLTGKAKRDKEWYRVDAPPFNSWMWRHSPKLHPFNRVLLEILTGFRYEYINETHKINRSDSIFYSIIDSLNVVDYDNDTIYLFQHDGEFLLEGRNHKVISGRKYPYNGWRSDINVFMSLTPNEQVQIGWLPEYMRQALISNDRKMLHTLCLDYETNESYHFNLSYSNGVFTPNPHLVFHKIVISNGKITERTKFDFEYFDLYQYRQAQLYALEHDAIQSNRVIDKAILHERVENSFLSHLLDSLGENSYYSSILRKHPRMKEWEKRYVIPMIDSLCSANMHSDTLYYYLEVSNNSLFNTAKFNSNNSRLYLHEIYNDRILWDTIKYGVEEVEFEFNTNGTLYDQMYESYELFSYPMRTSALPYLFNLANPIRWYYDYETRDFRKMYGRIDSNEETLKCRKLKDGEKILLFYRIEIRDGKIVDIVNDMFIP